MATKRLPPPLVGGIQSASIVDEAEDEAFEEGEPEDREVDGFWVSGDGQVDHA